MEGSKVQLPLLAAGPVVSGFCPCCQDTSAPPCLITTSSSISIYSLLLFVGRGPLIISPISYKPKIVSVSTLYLGGSCFAAGEGPLEY